MRTTSIALVLVAAWAPVLPPKPAAAQQPPRVAPGRQDRLNTGMHGYDMVVAVTQININAHFKYIFGREGGIQPTLSIKAGVHTPRSGHPFSTRF